MADIAVEREVLRGREYATFMEALRTHGGATHLDYGCGGGTLCASIAEEMSPLLAIGYDTDTRKIDAAKITHPHDRVAFASDFGAIVLMTQRNSLPRSFSSVSCSLSLHDMGDIERSLHHIRNITAVGGLFWILEHNLKGRSLSEFRNMFQGAQEREEIARLGLQEAYKTHTLRGADEYRDLVSRHGFIVEQAFQNPHYCSLLCRKGS